MKTKLRVIVLALLATILSLAYVLTPYAVKTYVRQSHPDINVTDVDVQWGRFTFNKVLVRRENVKAALDTVVVTWTTDGVQDIEVIGGTVFFEEAADKKAKSLQPEAYNLHGRDLTLHAKRSDLVAQMTGASFDTKKVCFTAGDITYRDVFFVELVDGCLSRSGKEATAGQAKTRVSLPWDLPGFPQDQEVTLTGLSVDLENKSAAFQAADLPPVLQMGESKVSLTHVDVRDLWVNHPWVAPDPVLFSHVDVTKHDDGPNKGFYSLILNDEAVIVVDPFLYSLKGWNTCDEWLNSMPEPLPPALAQARGHFSGRLEVAVAKDPKPVLNLTNRCKFECSAEPIASIISALRKRGAPVEYEVYDKDNNLFTRTLGPSTKEWVSFDKLPPHVTKAFVTLEDPGFWRHNGIISQALENSFKDNLKLGKFFRGGSTISMQLAKNLWLKRHKTIGRKAHEALLTTILESCLSKEEILTLYLNAVEYGPNLYGIDRAARIYFGKPASRLNAEEAFYLAALLPHPHRAVPPSRGGLARTRKLMAKLAKNGFISEEELEAIPLDEEEDLEASGWVAK